MHRGSTVSHHCGVTVSPGKSTLEPELPVGQSGEMKPPKCVRYQGSTLVPGAMLIIKGLEAEGCMLKCWSLLCASATCHG